MECESKNCSDLWSRRILDTIIGFWKGHPMPKGLKKYLNKLIVPTDFAIHYYIGGGLSGETNLQLRGDGHVELWSTVTEGYQRKSYSGEVSVSEVTKIATLMLATKIWQVKHDHSSRGLDESGARIRVKAGEQTSEVMLWVSEIRESPPFVVVQRQLLALIHELSAQEVREYGRGTWDIPYTYEMGQKTKRDVLGYSALKEWLSTLSFSIRSLPQVKEPTKLER